MLQLRARKVPENLKQAFRLRLTFIAGGRIRIMLPLLSLLLLYFLVRSLSGFFGGSELDSYTYVDAGSLLIIVAFSCFFFIYEPKNETDVGLRHMVMQNIFAMIILFWAATVTRISIIAAGGGATLIICFLLTGALLLIELKFFLIFSALSCLILFLRAGLNLNSPGAEFFFHDFYLVGMSFLLSLVINHLSRDQILKAFLLEHELEDEVDYRTRELAAETEKARRSDHLKTVFLANMSHEIRTPLNGILGFANLLRDERLKPETRREYVDIVLRSGNTLLEILNGIIEVSRIESDEVELYIEEFCLNDLLRETLSGFRGNEKIRNGVISLVDKSDGYEPVFIVTDRLKIVQIIMNLVNNAVKYTDAGVVSVDYRLNGADVYISVEDTGCGIKEEDQDSIFDRFQQTESAAYSPAEGVGLGLTIVKAYTELLSGEIRLESEYGRGSVFTLKLPLNFNA